MDSQHKHRMSITYFSHPESDEIKISVQLAYDGKPSTISFNIYTNSHCEQDDYQALWNEVATSLAENRQEGFTEICYNRHDGNYSIAFDWKCATITVCCNSFGYQTSTQFPIDTKKWEEIGFEILSMFPNGE